MLYVCLIYSSSNPFIAVVVCSYNNEKWVIPNLESIFMQRYTNYHIYYCDDASTDNTLAEIQSYVRMHEYDNKITLITNKERRYKLYNLYSIIHNLIPNDAIVAEIDGDDWLLANDVFDYIVSLYKNKEVWMTYGGFIAWPYTFSYLNPQSISQEVIRTNSFRSFYQRGFIFMAFRTFYAALFKKIKKEDLYDENDTFFTRSSDVVTMIPMFEMAGDHFYFIDKICYCYNTDTGHNDYLQDKALQNKIYNMVRAREKYFPLARL